MRSRIIIGGAIIAVIGLALGAAAAAGPLSSSSSSTLPSSSCGPLFYKGSGSPQYIIATDLPLQGAGRAQLLAMQQAVQFVLEKQYKFKAGKYSVGYQGCDDSTAQTGAWDPAKCSSNARAYAAEKTLLGVLGTFNSGLREARSPDPEPGSGRRGRDGQLREHECGSDAQGTMEQPRRAEDLLPDGRAELRTGRGIRRLPGPCRRESAPEQGLQVGPGQEVQGGKDGLHRS